MYVCLVCFGIAQLQKLLFSLKGAIGRVLTEFSTRCQNDKELNAAAEIGTMLGETLEGASRFVEDTLAVEEESAVEKVRRLERFRPVSLGEAVDKEVAAWHSAICSKLNPQPGSKRDPFRPRIDLELNSHPQRSAEEKYT